MGTSIAPVSTSTAFFDDLAFRFLHSSEFSPTTVRTYRTALNAFFGWLADRTSIEFIFQVSTLLPLLGVITGFLPNIESKSGK